MSVLKPQVIICP